MGNRNTLTEIHQMLRQLQNPIVVANSIYGSGGREKESDDLPVVASSDIEFRFGEAVISSGTVERDAGLFSQPITPTKLVHPNVLKPPPFCRRCGEKLPVGSQVRRAGPNPESNPKCSVRYVSLPNGPQAFGSCSVVLIEFRTIQPQLQRNFSREM